MCHEGLTHAKPVGRFVNKQITAFCVTHYAATDEEAHSQPAEE